MSIESGMPPLNLPPVELRTKTEDGTVKLYDPLRDKFVALTPEEYVRRHFTEYLLKGLHYPASLTANEVGIKLNDCKRRCDTVVYNPDGTLLMIVEYKSPAIAITQDVFDQIARYNLVLKARYLVVSNGMRHYCCLMDYERRSYHFIRQIPDYNEIRNPFSRN